MFNPTLKIFKTNNKASLPVFSTKDSACFDVSACLTFGTSVKVYGQNLNITKQVSQEKEELVLLPGDRASVPTGLILDIPRGYSVRIHSRSGLSFKNGIILSNCEGIIDSDYVQELMILLTNVGSSSFTIKHGDRIAQAELVKSLDYRIIECYNVPTQKTDRNGGFGSTGV
jgi:dUTP pyrophosphatase